MSGRDCAIIAGVGLATLLPFIGQRHDVGTHELRHAEIAREMAAGDGVIVPKLLGEEYVDKPPVMHVLVAGLYRLTDAPSLGLARLPSVGAAVTGALALYGIGLALTDRRTALFAALALLAVFDYHRMARVARPDMLFVGAILVSCLTAVGAMRATDPPPRRGRLAGAGAAAGLASVIKGPLGAAVPVLFGLLAPVRRRDLRRLSASEWGAFAVGLLIVLAAWAIPAYLADHGGYLQRVLTQPDLRGYDAEQVSGASYLLRLAVGFLPLTVFLPAVAVDVRRRGYTPEVVLSVVLLILLLVVPKKRPHYLLPIYPFLALAVTEAVSRVGHGRWLFGTAAALVTFWLAAGPLYYATLPLWTVPSEEPKLVMARRIRESIDLGHPIVCMDELAEAIAFEEGRDGVSEIPDLPGVVERARRNGPGSYVAVPGALAKPFLARAAGQIVVADVLSERIPVGRRTREWHVYRVVAVTR